jgi:hypothetical protein
MGVSCCCSYCTVSGPVHVCVWAVEAKRDEDKDKPGADDGPLTEEGRSTDRGKWNKEKKEMEVDGRGAREKRGSLG